MESKRTDRSAKNAERHYERIYPYQSRLEDWSRWISPVLIGIFLSSCTFTITNVHTQGEASDVVDENASTSPDIKADATIPLKP